ncbi:hypothetical protein B5F53_11090 [Blautia sp. An249]|nr:hypothetical protein B5F53_11090 [Blautia sp. An249]
MISALFFLFNRKLRSLLNKTLRLDRTASEWKKALCAPRRRRRILRAGFFFIIGNSKDYKI